MLEADHFVSSDVPDPFLNYHLGPLGSWCRDYIRTSEI